MKVLGSEHRQIEDIDLANSAETSNVYVRNYRGFLYSRASSSL
ncbi:phosphotransferase family protein [Aspergillus luchuensis]|uniref:Phosphotransferase family protein n=1 Tax=Aspergillus kawachii TaxID=1069201 RepID=A0A146FZ55_ASPKA|nr:phosphotransferase family protein [Aspergillus luchuensis]